MPNYSLLSKSGSDPDRTDPIGTFPNRDIALDRLNESIAGYGKESGDAALTIDSFTLEDSGLNQFCSLKYFLVESLNGNEVLHPLFPKSYLQFNPMKTTNAKGSFTH